ncbi:MAG: DUF4097 family beta strand repeat-containing protein [Proteobacteria bacterium]|nr:DUF4097 family beta strand repeat-containing protein [Pseudomonadota bacterium]
MRNRFESDSEDERYGERSGLGGILRSLLAGIPWSDRAETEEQFELDAPAGGVKIHNANGRTRVLGEDRDNIAVRAVKHARAESTEAAERLLDAIRVTATEAGENLELDVVIPRKWNRHGNVHLEVRLPRTIQVAVIASNGRLCLEGMRNSVRARSSNGPVHVEDVVGDLQVHTSNAKIVCQCTSGRLMARSSNGKIELRDHRGPVDASTSNGVISAYLADVGEGGIVLATSNGRIILTLPENVDADIDMRVDNGVIRNDRVLASQTRESNGRVRGTLGRGGSLIKLRTSNGTISLR